MHIKKITLIAALITSTGHATAGGMTAVSPTNVVLDKKIVRVNIDNMGDEKKIFDISKSDDWMLIAPTHLELEPGKRGVIKVARNIEKGADVVKGHLALKDITTGGGGQFNVGVMIPAASAGKSE